MRKRWKRLNFCGSGSTLKKEAGSGSKLNIYANSCVTFFHIAEKFFDTLGAHYFLVSLYSIHTIHF